jgi:hypothetical protein
LCAATVTALESDSTERTNDVCSKLETALSLVTRPLQRILQKPDPARIILQELEASKARFYGHFYTAKVDWDVPFDDRTEILRRLKHIGVFAQAQVLSGEDYAFYKQLDTQSTILDPQSLCEINDRWNRLCHSVKEYMDTGVVSKPEMNQFAQVSLGKFHLALPVIHRSFSGAVPSSKLLFFYCCYIRNGSQPVPGPRQAAAFLPS